MLLLVKFIFLVTLGASSAFRYFVGSIAVVVTEVVYY